MLNNIGLPGLVLLLVMFAIVPWIFWRVLSKAGFSGAWGLVAIVPGGAIVLMLVLAFATWPTQRLQG